MKYNTLKMLEDRLLRRELGNQNRYATSPGIYGDLRFVRDLDIVNELKGHDGCVNALSWSTSGKILASGSDDQVINLYSYLPEASTQQFSLVTQIDTGHNGNIFSVKFMPHSNDRKIVSCAGDSQIRVFDIERALIVGGEQTRLSTVSTCAKSFRSHSSSAKRIVTEASPFYFLSCAEDGDVRQWDIRQPESAYPRSRSRYAMNTAQHQHDDAPPPLISYRDYNIDLFTISCSPSQPHYIALGGRHMHCFLHDRRMLGRNKQRERGGPPLCSPPRTDAAVDAMMAATRCVRKFAPYGQPTMSASQDPTITACKISNANPNELIVSWSGDHIYSFDILHEDSIDTEKVFMFRDSGSAKMQRKRKRPEVSHSTASIESSAHASSRPYAPRSEDMPSVEPENVSILVRLRNGQSVEIPIESSGAIPTDTSIIPAAAGSIDSRFRIAKELMDVRREMFTCHTSAQGEEMHYTRANDTLQNREAAMIRIVAKTVVLFEKVDDAITHWSYPVTRVKSRIAFEQKLRDDRAKAWRFVQTAGCLARVMLKEAPTVPSIDLLRALKHFDIVRPAPRESSRPLERHEHFCYDFVKTVLLWLDSGIGAVISEFTRTSDSMQDYPRRQPIEPGAGAEAIGTHLMPYLRRLAIEQPVVDVDPDEPGEDHVLFQSELAAVYALERAMKVPFADLQGSRAVVHGESEAITQTRRGFSQPRNVALKFWGMKVCRSLLRTAAIDVDYPLTELAFGEIHGASDDTNDREIVEPTAAIPASAGATIEHSTEMEVDAGNADGLDVASDYSASSADDSTASCESSEEDAVAEEGINLGGLRRMPQAKSRSKAGMDVPCSTHTRDYRGHCNIDTTKDVNFYGLQDEYVVSGSNCGNVFIWDKATTKLLNILEGDGEVVNVIQPHPYEPLLAVSGIDHTIKIFSPDARARHDAEHGIGVVRADPSAFSSIGTRNRRRRRQAAGSGARYQRHGEGHINDGGSDDDHEGYDSDIDNGPSGHRSQRAGIILSPPSPGTVSPLSLSSDESDSRTSATGLPSAKRMASASQITSQNDMDRRSSSSGGVSRAMMALMTQRFRLQLASMGLQVGTGADDGDDDPENCLVM